MLFAVLFILICSLKLPQAKNPAPRDQRPQTGPLYVGHQLQDPAVHSAWTGRQGPQGAPKQAQLSPEPRALPGCLRVSALTCAGPGGRRPTACNRQGNSDSATQRELARLGRSSSGTLGTGRSGLTGSGMGPGSLHCSPTPGR